MPILRLPPKEYSLLIHKVLSRDGYRCQSCGFRGNLHVHHVWFRSHGGPDLLWNLVTLCECCHSGVHTAVKDGEYGLVVRTDMNGFTFIKAPWWRPGQ